MEYPTLELATTVDGETLRVELTPQGMTISIMTYERDRDRFIVHACEVADLGDVGALGRRLAAHAEHPPAPPKDNGVGEASPPSPRGEHVGPDEPDERLPVGAAGPEPKPAEPEPAEPEPAELEPAEPEPAEPAAGDEEPGCGR